MKEPKAQESLLGGSEGVNRRSFVKGVGFAGLGAAGASFLAGRLGLVEGLPGAKALGFSSP